MEKHSLFAYKAGNSFVHRLPSVIKILLIPVLNIVFFNLPIYFSLGLILFQTILAFCIKFTVREQAEYFTPVLFFAVILYFTSFLGIFFSNFDFFESLKECLKNKETLLMLIKLFCVLQTSSIVFKTSTSLQIREGIGQIESVVRKILPVSKKNTFTDTISLFICFIPLVFSIWEESKRAWKARFGKSSVRMYMTLVPILFSVGMKKAYNSARAILNRNPL